MQSKFLWDKRHFYGVESPPMGQQELRQVDFLHYLVAEPVILSEAKNDNSQKRSRAKKPTRVSLCSTHTRVILC
jgi:hypothetical protein